MSGCCCNPTEAVPADAESATRERYAAAAAATEPALCCPIDYDPKYLEILPQELIDKDYGCGDPSAFARQGDVVLDLGSGGGKICYIASQIVGPEGRVIGVDMTDDMLDLARRHREEIAGKVGWDNVTFHKGRIQDLRTDLDQVETWLGQNRIESVDDLQAFEAWKRRFEVAPMIADDSVDLVVSNCVLNLVEPADKSKMFAEIFRVLKQGGRAAISDIVSDEDVPQHMQDDPDLWSGCISGALREDAFLEAFEEAGFHGVEIVKWDEEPWQTVGGIQFRSVTVLAWKGTQGACWDRNQAVVYKGPYKAVLDDDGHYYPRGLRVAVCDKTFGVLRDGSYADHFVFIEPLEAIPLEEAAPFPCSPPEEDDGHHAPWVLTRSPRVTKGEDYDATDAGGCCGGGGGGGCC
jgi:arsenite methyltransferase